MQSSIWIFIINYYPKRKWGIGNTSKEKLKLYSFIMHKTLLTLCGKININHNLCINVSNVLTEHWESAELKNQFMFNCDTEWTLWK